MKEPEYPITAHTADEESIADEEILRDYDHWRYQQACAPWDEWPDHCDFLYRAYASGWIDGSEPATFQFIIHNP